MDANSLLQLILLTIALGALVYCLIQARDARGICNKLMKDIERYIKKSEQMELPLKMKKTKKKGKKQVMYLSHMCRNRRPRADMRVEFALKPLFYANNQVLDIYKGLQYY